MKGIRFFLEYPNKTEKNKATVKNLGNHSGNCIGIYIGQWIPGTMQIEAATGIYFHPNSAVASSSVDYEYLRERCKRIPERLVKDIHPELYNYLKD